MPPTTSNTRPEADNFVDQIVIPGVNPTSGVVDTDSTTTVESVHHLSHGRAATAEGGAAPTTTCRPPSPKRPAAQTPARIPASTVALRPIDENPLWRSTDLVPPASSSAAPSRANMARAAGHKAYRAPNVVAFVDPSTLGGDARRYCGLCLEGVVDAMLTQCCHKPVCRECTKFPLDPDCNPGQICPFFCDEEAHDDARHMRGPRAERNAPSPDADNETTMMTCTNSGCGFSAATRDALAAHVDTCDPPIPTLISNLANVSAIAARGGLLPPLHRNDAALRSVRGAVTKLLMTSFAAAASPGDRDALQRRLEADGVYVRTTVGAPSDAGGSTDRRSGDGGSPHARFTVQRDPGGGVALRHTDSGAPAADWYIMQVGAPVTGSSVQRVTIPALGQCAVVEGVVAAEDFQGPVAIFAGRSRAALVLDDGGVHDEGAGS